MIHVLICHLMLVNIFYTFYVFNNLNFQIKINRYKTHNILKQYAYFIVQIYVLIAIHSMLFFYTKFLCICD